MTCSLRLDQCCIVLDCLRPARDHGHCVQCYMSLTARERALLKWEASFGPTPTAQQAARDLRFMPHAAETLARMAEDLVFLERLLVPAVGE